MENWKMSRPPNVPIVSRIQPESSSVREITHAKLPRIIYQTIIQRLA